MVLEEDDFFHFEVVFLILELRTGGLSDTDFV